MPLYALLLRGDGGAGPSALQWVGPVGAYYKVAPLLVNFNKVGVIKMWL